jgi:hypothetical protein
MSVPANLDNVRALYGLAKKIMLQVLDKVKEFSGRQLQFLHRKFGEMNGGVGSAAAAWAAPDHPFLLQGLARQGDKNGARKVAAFAINIFIVISR